MTHSRRGFTLMELAICLTILAIVVPMLYAFGRNMEDRTALGLASLETADSTRTIAETLRLDARGARWTDATAVQLTRASGCTVAYSVQDGVLTRNATEGCEGPPALASRVESITRVPGGVEVVFRQARRPGPTEGTRVAVRIPVEVER